MNRTTRRVAPTEAGREYYERLSQVLTELDEAEQAVGAASVVPQGRLRVSSLSAFGLSHVMSAVADYAAQYPQVTVEMTLSDRVVELIDEGFDVAIRASPSGLKSSSLIARQIATAHLVLCASPDYLRRHGTPLNLRICRAITICSTRASPRPELGPSTAKAGRVCGSPAT